MQATAGGEWVCKSEKACANRVRSAQFGQVDVELRFSHEGLTVWEQYTGHRTGVDGLVAVNRPGQLMDDEGRAHVIHQHWQLIHAPSGGYMCAGYSKDELIDLASRLEPIGPWDVAMPTNDQLTAAAHVAAQWSTDRMYERAEQALVEAA